MVTKKTITLIIAVVIGVILLHYHFKPEREFRQACAAKNGTVLEGHDAGLFCIHQLEEEGVK